MGAQIRLPKPTVLPRCARSLALAQAAVTLACRTPAPAGPAVERLGSVAAWHYCALAGERRPAAPCPPPRLVASALDQPVPESGMLEVSLADPGPEPVLLVADAYTYAEVPEDPVIRATWKSLPRALARATNHRALGRALRHPAFRRARQPPPARGALAPSTLTLRFDAAERDRHVAFAVWAVPILDASLVFESVTPRASQRLALAFGLRDPVPDGGARVRFAVTAAASDGTGERELWHRVLAADANSGWQEAEIALSTFAGRTIRLAFKAHPVGGDAPAALPVWARPALIETGARPASPSILLVSLDTLRADHVGAYGYGRPTTPALDRLAASGILFEQVVAPFPSTTASHMTMLTSLEPCTHQVLTPASVLAEAIPTVTERLAAHGYATVAITEDGLIKGDRGFERGFDSYRDLLPAPEAPLGRFDQGLALARAWLERHAGLPFFMFLHTYQVHVPYKVPPHYQGLFPLEPGASPERQQEAEYDAGLRHADDLFRSFLDFLDEHDLLSETVLIVTSDHGTEFGEHGGIGHARGVYEEHVRVPLIVHHPTLAGPRRVAAQVGLIDLAPTMLELAGDRPPATFAGTSLLPWLRDGASPPRAALFAEQLWGPRQTLLRTPRHAWLQKSTGLELYDLGSDPTQQRDIAAEAPELAAEGARRIQRFRADCLTRRTAANIPGVPAQALDPERLEALRALGYVE